MARGFESKAVADQQEEAARRREARASEGLRADAGAERERRRLELQWCDLKQRLDRTQPNPLRTQLEQALAAVDTALAELQGRAT